MPGLYFVPLCLMIIFPAVTSWPPDLFTPKYFGLLSLPFLLLPTPFLLDISFSCCHYFILILSKCNIVSNCLCPTFLLYLFLGLYLKAITLSPFICFFIVAFTAAFSSTGLPISILSPSLIRLTSESVTLSPSLPSILSTTISLFSSILYCFPPLVIIA